MDFLSSTIKLNKILLLGDINVHVDDKSCHTASEFLSGSGYRSSLPFAIFISDHKYLLFDLSFISDTLPSVNVKHSRLITDRVLFNLC